MKCNYFTIPASNMSHNRLQYRRCDSPTPNIGTGFSSRDVRPTEGGEKLAGTEMCMFISCTVSWYDTPGIQVVYKSND